MDNIHEFNKHYYRRKDTGTPGGVTLYVQMDRDTLDMKVSWSVCASGDNFSRKTGASIAKKNMENGLYVTGTREYDFSVSDNLYDILSDGITDRDLTEKEDHYLSMAIDKIDLIDTIDDLEKFFYGVEEDFRVDDLEEDRNSLIDGFMSRLPFITMNLP